MRVRVTHGLFQLGHEGVELLAEAALVPTVARGAGLARRIRLRVVAIRTRLRIGRRPRDAAVLLAVEGDLLAGELAADVDPADISLNRFVAAIAARGKFAGRAVKH